MSSIEVDIDADFSALDDKSKNLFSDIEGESMAMWTL
jgi:hypothetical protein